MGQLATLRTMQLRNVGAAVAVAMAAELAADRLGPRLLPALPPGETEAAFKLGRLRELRRSGHSPRVLIVGVTQRYLP